MIELLVSITIIAILIAILVPALSSAKKTVQDGRARTEITALDQAITEFRTLHGVDPPSSLLLCEESGDWDTRSRELIRQIWPQFDFEYSLAPNGPTGHGTGKCDINRNGIIETEPLTLTGAEALVFFLCGIGDFSPEDTNKNGVIDGGEDANSNGILDPGLPDGFAKDPRNPFRYGGAREPGPFDFAPGRFVDLDGDNLLEYLGPFSGQSAPYLYASSYGGQGYNITPDLTVIPAILGMANVYLEPGGTPYKKNSYQIIFPGGDNLYGSGGIFDPANPHVLTNPADHDNITNFHSGRLVP